MTRAEKLAAQDARRAELVDIRQRRKLTDAELREEERLEKRLHMRVWRDATLDQAARLSAAKAGQPQPAGFA